MPLTSVVRTLHSPAEVGFSPEALSQASSEALQRGLASLGELVAVGRALAAYKEESR